jgi:glucokinase
MCATNENATKNEALMSAEKDESILVYDVGGTHVSASVCHADGLYRLGRVVSALHSAGQSREDFLDLLYSLGSDVCTLLDVAGAELAMPGPFDFDGGVSLMRHKLPYLYGINLRQLLAQRFGWRAERVRFVHDSAAFLLGEIGAGVARGASRAVCITLGTGIGSAFAVDGRVVTDGPGVPPGGEIWNLPYESGIVEDCISARAIQRFYLSRTGRLSDVAEIAGTASEDSSASAAFAEFGEHLGLVLRRLLTEFRPDVVVLGGGISKSAHLFLPITQRQLEDLDLRLQVSLLQDHAPLVGAAVAWCAA